MALTDKREEAETLYVRQSLPRHCQTVGYRRGDGVQVEIGSYEKRRGDDWDVRRRIYSMSLRELMTLYAESVKAWMIRIKETPELLSDSKIADAISKHISVMQKIDIRGQYLGVAIDLVKVVNNWLSENAPSVKTQMLWV